MEKPSNRTVMIAIIILLICCVLLTFWAIGVQLNHLRSKNELLENYILSLETQYEHSLNHYNEILRLSKKIDPKDFLRDAESTFKGTILSVDPNNNWIKINLPPGIRMITK